MVPGARAVAALGLLALMGCAAVVRSDIHRTTEGPTAEDIFAARFQAGYNRGPTFDELAAFRLEMDQRLTDYLTRRPDVASSPRVSQLRFARRVAVGMPREEVVLLVGEPLSVSRDRATMQQAAGLFWPAIQERGAQELWTYPGRWSFYMSDNQLVDLTYVGAPPQ